MHVGALVSAKKAVGGTFAANTENLERLKDLFEKGQYRPVIDRVYSLGEIVEAHRYVDTGRKKGSVVIKLI